MRQRYMYDRKACCLLSELTLNDLCGGTAGSVAFEGSIGITCLLQQVTQLLTGLQLVLLQSWTLKPEVQANEQRCLTGIWLQTLQMRSMAKQVHCQACQDRL